MNLGLELLFPHEVEPTVRADCQFQVHEAVLAHLDEEKLVASVNIVCYTSHAAQVVRATIDIAGTNPGRQRIVELIQTTMLEFLCGNYDLVLVDYETKKPIVLQ